MKIGTHAHTAAAQITRSPWLTSSWAFPPHLWDAIRQGSYGAFFNQQSSYNTSMWTMSIELLGSFIVFGFLAFFGKVAKRWVLYAVLAIVFIHSWYLAFLIGMAISDIWINYPNVKNKITPNLATALLLIGVICGSWHTDFNIHPVFYSRLNLPFFGFAGTEQLMQTIGATCILIAILRLVWLSRFFEHRVLQYLGRISFSLYLVHFAIIYSFSAFAFSHLYPHFGYVLSVFITAATSAPLILLVAHFYSKYVDAYAVSLSRRIGNWLLSSQTVRVKPESTAEQNEPLPIPTSIPIVSD